MTSLAHRTAAALALAERALELGPHSTRADGRPRTLRVVMGDPQADFARVMAVLDAHGLLGDDGRLAPHVLLVSVGDHFDWGAGPGPGAAERRAQVAASAERLVAWLAHHPADQAVLLLGNHDLARVGELAGMSDARFATLQAESDAAYRPDAPEAEHAALEAEFRARWPGLPGAELAARDFSAYREAQGRWVAHLLRARRFRTAWAASPDVLVLHAGVTRADLEVARLDPELRHSAFEVEAALERALEAALARWEPGTPLVVPGLHRPGARDAEGTGIFYHRPSVLPAEARLRARTPRRRFDPRRLPTGLTQVVGHTRDGKMLELLGLDPARARDGVLRHLLTDGVGVAYAHGPPGRLARDEAALVFTDGGMQVTPPVALELFDVDARAAAARRAG